MNRLIFNFEATFCQGWPQGRIVVDNDIIQEFTIDNNVTSITIDLDYLDGPHTLEIERYGKTNDNIVFVNNEILQDQSLNLVSVYLDDVLLPNYVLYQGTFYWDNNVCPSTLHWGPNGKWVLDFNMPFVTWVIDLANREDLVDVIVPRPDNADIIKTKISTLRSLWQSNHLKNYS